MNILIFKSVHTYSHSFFWTQCFLTTKHSLVTTKLMA
uniref:Uncharacterized protein n=1 Tax=Rhizophora mucronata TaxID=61149 RepID=A0A2P2PB39_RHIMU